MAISKDKTTVQTILEISQLDSLKDIAKKKGLSVSAYIRVLILEDLENQTSTSKKKEKE